jgi:hypothetical protein
MSANLILDLIRIVLFGEEIDYEAYYKIFPKRYQSHMTSDSRKSHMSQFVEEIWLQ